MSPSKHLNLSPPMLTPWLRPWFQAFSTTYVTEGHEDSQGDGGEGQQPAPALGGHHHHGQEDLKHSPECPEHLTRGQQHTHARTHRQTDTHTQAHTHTQIHTHTHTHTAVNKDPMGLVSTGCGQQLKRVSLEWDERNVRDKHTAGYLNQKNASGPRFLREEFCVQCHPERQTHFHISNQTWHVVQNMVL